MTIEERVKDLSRHLNKELGQSHNGLVDGYYMLSCVNTILNELEAKEAELSKGLLIPEGAVIDIEKFAEHNITLYTGDFRNALKQIKTK